MTKVITRFPPSPTGFLHIGGARTALFNWLYAKANNGDMVLRIEDTDRERSTDEAVTAILSGLEWLGLDYANEPYSQYANRDRHKEIAQQLLEMGHAYYCYATPDELEHMRETARAKGEQPRYDGRWRDKSADDAPDGVDPVIRIKAPTEGTTLIEDHVQGRVEIPNKTLDDMIILRSDGTPTYMLAVVVDDHDMGITHIIRGDDHLNNTARQMVIYRAMNWDIPHMAHIPLIHGSDGAKLSKRHGALGVEEYRKMGFLPEALLNYLVRLGWSLGDEEIISVEQMMTNFDLKDINKAASRFDMAKLEHINAHYIKETADTRLLDLMIELINEAPEYRSIIPLVTNEAQEKILAAMPSLKSRAKTVRDLIDEASFLYQNRPIDIEADSRSFLEGDNQNILRNLTTALEVETEWSHESLSQFIKNFCKSYDLKMPQVAKPMRTSLTGKANSIGIYEILLLLGREEAINRLRDSI